MENQTFLDKVAFITGAASGIGESVARRLAELGGRVAIADVNLEAAQRLATELTARNHSAFACQIDVSTPESVQAAVAATVAEFGALHFAVNSAGIGGQVAPIADYDIDIWRQITAINYSGVFYSMKYEIDAMLKTGKGAIINLSSIHGVVGSRNAAGYVAAKHGVVGMTKTAALDYAAQGIRVNAVCPGFIETPLIQRFEKEQLIAQHPIGRLGKTEEVAELILFLLSDKASFITGSQYLVDGGFTAL